MFADTKHNVDQFFKSGVLPVLLSTAGVSNNQENIDRPLGIGTHHFLWVLEGEGIFECEDLTVVLNEGTGVFFKAHSPHKYYRTSKEFKTAWFTFYGLDGLLKYYNINNAFKFDVPEFLTFPYFSFEELAGSDSTAISRSAKTHCLVADIFSSHFSSKTTLSTLIDQYLENHFGEMISLDSLALQFNMTKFALCRKYNKESGRTIIEQLQKIRIAKAKRYLSSTSLSVEEIGKMCGFDSPSYFCKTFKNLTLTTPNGYRKAKTAKL